MELTVYNPNDPFPPKVGAVVFEVRETFEDGTQWAMRTDIELIVCSAAAGAHDLGRLEARRRIGRVKLPFQSAFATVEADELVDWWIRARLVQQSGASSLLFVGRIESEAREVFGGDVNDGVANVTSEVRTLVAYGPRQYLRKITVSESDWLQVETENDIQVPHRLRVGWVPGMNHRDHRKMLTGNRSARPSQPQAGATDGTEVYLDETDPDASYLYGGTDLWSRRQYAQYVLNNFVNVRDPDTSEFIGPVWRLAGQAELLDDAVDYLVMQDVMTVDDILRAIIQPKFGVDWFVRVTDGGDQTPAGVPTFEVIVFALLPKDEGFGEATLPANPNRVEVRTRKSEIEANIITSAANSYSAIRIIGARGVLCCSIEALTPQKIDALGTQPTMVGKWATALETEYREGAGPEDTYTADEHDDARGQTRFDPVYQHFGAPSDWQPPAPLLITDGEVLDQRDNLPESYPDQQRVVRRTLPWIPLKSGIDYSGDEPVDENDEGVEGVVMPPLVFIYRERDPSLPEPPDGADTPGDYILAERAREAISVRASLHDWGVVLNATPNHILGKGRFEIGLGTQPSRFEPAYNPGKFVATIAFEIDQRLTLEHRLAVDDGTIQIIEMPDCEVWHVADQTVVGVSPAGLLVRSGPKTLRNDAPRMHLIMAGAIARYENDRARAELHIEGWAPWGDQIGSILTRIHDGANTHELAAPISFIEWRNNGGKPTTVVKTGYAK